MVLPDKSNGEVEHSVCKRFLSHFSSANMVCKRESPDFLIILNGEKIGFELTQYLPSGELLGLRKQRLLFATNLDRSLQEADNPNHRSITIEFGELAQAPGRRNQPDLPKLASEVPKTINDQLKSRSFLPFTVPINQELSRIGINLISVAPFDEKPVRVVFRDGGDGHTLPAIQTDHLRDRIQSKCLKLPAFRTNLPDAEQHLLIFFDSIPFCDALLEEDIPSVIDTVQNIHHEQPQQFNAVWIAHSANNFKPIRAS